MTDAELWELDAEIHRRVFGRESRPMLSVGRQPMLDRPRRDNETHNPVPPYSTDIAAAWTVVEWMTKTHAFRMNDDMVSGWLAAFTSGERIMECRWLAEFTSGEGIRGGARHSLAPLAICRAALAAGRDELKNLYMRCSVSDGLRPDQVTCAITDHWGHQHYLRAQADNLLVVSGVHYIQVSPIHAGDTERLIELPDEADSGYRRLWVNNRDVITD